MAQSTSEKMAFESFVAANEIRDVAADNAFYKFDKQQDVDYRNAEAWANEYII